MKKTVDVIRAWRDEEYRNSLTEEERANLPESPAGMAVVSDATLRSITGGCGSYPTTGPTSKYNSCVTWPEQCP